MRSRFLSRSVRAVLPVVVILGGANPACAHGGHGGHRGVGSGRLATPAGSSHRSQTNWLNGANHWHFGPSNPGTMIGPQSVVDYPDDLPEARLGRFLGHVLHRHES